MAFTFDGAAQTVTWSGGPLSVREMWSRYVDWLAVSDNSKYGTMLYTVGRRRHELGVRAALGADRSRLVRLVLWSGARVTAVGLAIGVGGALLATRALRSMLFGVSATDPGTLVAVALLMGIVAMAASLVPAWRAAQADPLEAMRAE